MYSEDGHVREASFSGAASRQPLCSMPQAPYEAHRHEFRRINLGRCEAARGVETAGGYPPIMPDLVC